MTQKSKKIPKTEGVINRLRSLSVATKLEVLLVVVLLFVSMAVRVNGIDSSLWHDEAATMVEFVDKGLVDIMTGEGYRPNNHILFSLVTWLIVNVVGFSEVAVRLPSILATVASFLVMYLLARRNVNRSAAIILLTILALGHSYVNVTSEARGYGFVLLFGSLFLYFVLRYSAEVKVKYLIYALILAFLAVYTYPSYLLFVMATIGAVFCAAEKERKKIILATFGLGSAVLAAFLPMVRNIKYYYVDFGGGFVNHDSVGWDAFFTVPITRIEMILEPFVGHALNFVSTKSHIIDARTLFQVAVAAIFLWGVYEAWHRAHRVLTLVLIPATAFVVICSVFSVPIGSSPRYTIFLDVSYLLIFSIGLSALLTYIFGLYKKYKNIGLAVASLAAILLIGFVALALRETTVSLTSDRLLMDDFKSAVRVVQEQVQDEDYMLIANVAPATGRADSTVRARGFQFYTKELLNRDDLVAVSSNEEAMETLRVERGDKRAIVFDYVFHKEPISALFPEIGDATYIFGQHRGRIDVYIR